MTDADGNTIENENIILSGTKGKQKITVQKAGTYYLTYFIDEDEYNTADHRNQYAANLTVTRPTVKFIVEKVSLNNNADTNNPQINNNQSSSQDPFAGSGDTIDISDDDLPF